MKTNVKSIIKRALFALGLVVAFNSVRPEIAINEVTPIEEFTVRFIGAGLAAVIAKSKKASSEFLKHFAYINGLLFANDAIKKTDNVTENTIDSAHWATLAALYLPVMKIALDGAKSTTINELNKLIVSLGRYGVAYLAAVLSQEALVAGYGFAKTLISNQISA